jgi:transposase-like protein
VCSKPLDPVYPVIFIDLTHIEIRDGKVANRAISVTLAVTCDSSATSSGCWRRRRRGRQAFAARAH